MQDFPDNTIDTENVVRCVNETECVRSFVNTSTQYVVMPGVRPPDAAYLEPYTAYGESKAAAECTVREQCTRPWSIVRPTNIWGPRHCFFPYEMWRYLERRYYLHTGYEPIRRYYGYVENAIRQILKIALTDYPTDAQGIVWYITDTAIDSAEWMNGFSVALSGKPARRIPLPLWRAMAVAGDLMRALGLRPPVNSDRQFRLTVNENLPDDMIMRLEPSEVISLRNGIARSVVWYRQLKTGTPVRG